MLTGKTITLSQRSHGTLFQPPSELKAIQERLTESVTTILADYQQKMSDTETADYNDRFRSNHLKLTMKRDLLNSLTDVHEQLRANMKYPARLNTVFQQMMQDVCKSLTQMGYDAHQFDNVFQEFLNPKEVAAKVPLNGMGG